MTTEGTEAMNLRESGREGYREESEGRKLLCSSFKKKKERQIVAIMGENEIAGEILSSSRRGSGFDSQFPHDGSQPSVIPVPEGAQCLPLASTSTECMRCRQARRPDSDA